MAGFAVMEHIGIPAWGERVPGWSRGQDITMVSTVEGERVLAELIATGVAEDPYPAYALLRERGPVTFLPARSLWIVTGYDECRAVLRDSARFPAWSGPSFFAPGQPPAPPVAPGPIPEDGDARQQRRQCAYHALSPRSRGVALEPTMREVAEGLVAALPHGQGDLVSGLAAPFAAAVLAAYFGLPQPAWHDYLGRWLAELRPADGRPRGLTGPATEMIRAANLRRARAAFEQALRIELDQRRTDPRDDVLTALAQAADGSDAYTDEESLRIVPTLANNAFLGLSDLAGTVLWQLLANPWLAQAVTGDDRLLGGAIEEILRLDPPVQAVQRQAMAAVAVSLGGARIPAGAPVLVLLAAANRDPALFPAPDQLDPWRPNAADHLSFGHGVDFCIGAPLVRRAVTVLARVFVTQIVSVRLLEDARIRHWPNPFNRGWQRLDVIISE